MVFQITQSSAHFRNSLLAWVTAHFEQYAVLDSNGYFAQNKFCAQPTHDLLLAAGITDEIRCSVDCFAALDAFRLRHATTPQTSAPWMFGYLSYDLKNETEKLTSANPDTAALPRMHFFVPQVVISLQGDQVTVTCYNAKLTPELVWQQLCETQPFVSQALPRIATTQRTSKANYLQAVEKIKSHIQRGDVYEMNYCMEFFAAQVVVDPPSLFQRLNACSPAPFAALYKAGEVCIASSSPERFMTKQGDKIISQPMKGTARRDGNREADRAQAEALRQNEKERAENIMITDLVRNDLSRTAARGSVVVEELCGVYSFAGVHQMISTVSSRLRAGTPPLQAIRDAFPMGSMTGAPKVKAMQLIEEFEDMTRGIYSGALGYFDPEGNFDFSVLIRTIVYNQQSGALSFMVGSAITAGSVAEAEYEECLLKAAAMHAVLKGDGMD